METKEIFKSWIEALRYYDMLSELKEVENLDISEVYIPETKEHLTIVSFTEKPCIKCKYFEVCGDETRIKTCKRRETIW